MNEQNPNQNQDQLITEVPGMPALELPDSPARQGQAIPVEFSGDPRRVIGHPSNETNAAATAYGQQLGRQTETAQWKDIPVRYVQSVGSIAIDVDRPS